MYNEPSLTSHNLLNNLSLYGKEINSLHFIEAENVEPENVE